MEYKIMKSVMGESEGIAEKVRERLAAERVAMINIIGSPGAGKTTLLEKTLERLGGSFKLAVIEGDLATSRDAERLKRAGMPMVMINTDGGCYLQPLSIDKALDEFDLSSLDAILIENVGNLVCPAHFDLGEHVKVAVVSTTEGDDKPIKYPLLFREAGAAILNKMDLAQFTNFSLESFKRDLAGLHQDVPLFEVSCTNDHGMEAWYGWLEARIKSVTDGDGLE
jgi:hydrogenase nickel incorporation protein HypB